MKTLTNLKIKVDGNKATIECDIVDKQFLHPSQQTTVGHLADDNLTWARHIQLSQEAVFVKRIGCGGMAIPVEDLVAIAPFVEPRLTWAPKMEEPKGDDLNIRVAFVSELKVKLQWQISDDGKEGWTDIEGATSDAVSRKDLPAGKFVRCKAESDAGAVVTPPVKV